MAWTTSTYLNQTPRTTDELCNTPALRLSGVNLQGKRWTACGLVDASSVGSCRSDAFAPVPRSTAGRILMSMAAAEDLEMHCRMGRGSGRRL